MPNLSLAVPNLSLAVPNLSEAGQVKGPEIAALVNDLQGLKKLVFLSKARARPAHISSPHTARRPAPREAWAVARQAASDAGDE